MYKNIMTSRKRTILFSGLLLTTFVLIGIIFRWAWLSNRYATVLNDQLATSQMARTDAATAEFGAELSSEEAVMQAKIARSRELAAQSEAADERDAALKVLLAVELLKALNGQDLSNPYPSWIQQSLYDFTRQYRRLASDWTE